MMERLPCVEGQVGQVASERHAGGMADAELHKAVAAGAPRSARPPAPALTHLLERVLLAAALVLMRHGAEDGIAQVDLQVRRSS